MVAEGKRRSILLVVEGAKQEQFLMNKVLEEYGLDADYQIYSYGTNIYELYERMFAQGRDELEALSLIGILKEREADPAKRELLDINFSDILLVFDFEGEMEDRFSFERHAEMLEYFSESTDEGKLYINYPMVEACKHFSGLPDVGYLNRCVSVDDIESYKQIVGTESRFQNYGRDFCRPALDALILLSVAKSLKLCGCELDLSDFTGSCESVDHGEIYRRQETLYNEQSCLVVLGTCLMFICDYDSGLIDLRHAVRLSGLCGGEARNDGAFLDNV